VDGCGKIQISKENAQVFVVFSRERFCGVQLSGVRFRE
jgi:hypothetical protein